MRYSVCGLKTLARGLNIFICGYALKKSNHYVTSEALQGHATNLLILTYSEMFL